MQGGLPVGIRIPPICSLVQCVVYNLQSTMTATVKNILRATTFVMAVCPLLASTIEEDLVPPSIPYGSRIQRTMTLLATSTPEHKHKVRILYYGQSTVSAWTKMVDDHLRAKFPNADIVSENLAIGGFEAPFLVDTCESDLYPWYPDLLIFCDYGATNPAFEPICAGIRQRTTAEVLILTHHIADQPASVKNHDKEAEIIRQLADKYGFETVDIRASWRNHLEKNQYPPSKYLRDQIHYNPDGEVMASKIVIPHLQSIPTQAPTWLERVKYYGPDGKPLAGNFDEASDTVLKEPLKMEFEGNRVVVAALPLEDKPGTARILIDGKKPSEFPEMYTTTRPSALPELYWMPALRRLELGRNIQTETWVLTITRCNEDGTDFDYEIKGSLTGPDGKGSSREKFTSNSGRIAIDPKWFHMPVRKKPVPKGFEIRWQIKEMFLNEWKPKPITDKTKSNLYTLVQGLPNGKHTLEIIPNGDGDVPVRYLAVYKPTPPAP